MVEWLGRNAVWLMLAGAAMFLCGMGGMVLFVIVMPADHFRRSRPRADRPRRHWVLRILARVTKNVAGAVFLVAGLIMAIPMVPGPGVLFILLGVSLTDLPGKHAMVLYLVSRPWVLRPLNALRARWNRPPLQRPDDYRSG